MNNKYISKYSVVLLFFFLSIFVDKLEAQAMDVISTMDEKAGIYSLRLVEETYDGPLVEVRRSSDDSTINVYSDENGLLDEKQLLNFIKHDSAYIKVWYDQSGSSAHAVQTIHALQPMLVSEGIIQKVDGRMAIYFDEMNELELSSSTIATPLTINAVAKTTFGNGSRFIFDPNGAELYRWNVDPAVNELRVGSGSMMLPITGLDFNETFVSTSIINGNHSSISLNGTVINGSLGNKGITPTATIGSNTIGVGLVGYVYEILIFSDAMTVSERAMIEEDQIAFYLTPDAPRNVKVTTKHDEVLIEWQAPIRSYRPLVGYRVEYKRSALTNWTQHSMTTNRSVTITGLDDEDIYDFKVTALNHYGAGMSSTMMTRKMGRNWGLLSDAKAASNLLASTLYFPGVPNDDYATMYTATPLASETGFDDDSIRIQLKRMKSIGINAVQISFFGSDIRNGSKYLPMNAWRNRTDGQVFEDYDRLIRLIEEEGMYFYPLIETSSALPFYADFGVNNNKIVEAIQYWTERWGDSSSWLKLYNNEGNSMQAVSFIEAIKFKPYTSSYFEDNLESIAMQVEQLTDIQVGFLLDPTRLPMETTGGVLPSNIGPTPSELINSTTVLAIHPWEITVDGLTEEDRMTWATQFMKRWNDAGIPVVSFVVAGYDASNVFPASAVYGKTDIWREMQKTLAVPELGTSGVNVGPWNGWTEWFHITLSEGAAGDKNSVWAKDTIAINKKHQ